MSDICACPPHMAIDACPIHGLAKLAVNETKDVHDTPAREDGKCQSCIDITKKLSDGNQRNNVLVARIKGLESVLELNEIHACHGCGDWHHTDDLTEEDGDQWCEDCHDEHMTEINAPGYGCPGCEGGVPANCVCGREN